MPRETIWFKLYRQIGSGGTPEEVSSAGLKRLDFGTTTVTWTGLERTNTSGQSYIFTVREVDSTGNNWSPDNYNKAENGLKVSNSYYSDVNGTATATLNWVGGPVPKPTVYLQLWRKCTYIDEGGVTVTVDEKVPEAALKTMSDGMSSTNWSNLTVSHVPTGATYTFYVREVDAAGEDYTPNNYSKEEQGLNVTNTYRIPQDGSARASKTWIGGSAVDRPTIWFKLYRQLPGSAVEAVPEAEAPVKALTNGITSVTWNSLSRTDNDGKVYTFSVKEVNSDGSDINWKPHNYIKTEKNLTVENRYVAPQTAAAQAELSWHGGPPDRPTVWFKLYRKVAGGVREEVPHAEAPLKELPNGTLSVSWTELTATDENAQPYIFSVQEVDANGNDLTPAGYSKVEQGLHVKNSYIIPTDGVATATKTWEGGSAPRPQIWFRLYRQVGNGTAEPVDLTRAEIKTLTSGESSVSWSGQDRTDANGNNYTFSVKECDASGDVSWSPENYAKSENGLAVLNTYVPPTKGKAEATLKWVGGPADKPTVFFKLYRTTNGTNYEEVPEIEAPRKMLVNGVKSVNWTDLTQTDFNSNRYEFIVRQVDANGNDLTPENYRKEEEGLLVTNTYIIPRDKDVTATKEWVKGKDPRPDVWFKLYRQLPGGAPEPVSITQAPVSLLSGANGVLQVTWERQERTDGEGNEYTFSVRECDETGTDLSWSPENYVKAENGLTVTNTYKSPQNASAQATLAWVDGPETHPTVFFKLYRQIEGGESEAVPEADILILRDGDTEVNWTDLTKTDENGNTYTFSVVQVDMFGNNLTPVNYSKKETGLNVVNRYIPPKNRVVGEKIWIDGGDSHPDTVLRLYRKLNGGVEEAVPLDQAPLKTLSGGITVAVWSDIAQTDIDGNTYTFSVREVDATGADATPENYVKAENGLMVTNTYNSPKNAAATANIVWVDGPDEHPTVWLKLYRRVANGALEEVPESEASIIKMQSGSVEHAWTGLTKTDRNNNVYEFIVRQVDSAGNSLTPENYSKEEVSLTVTNAFIPQRTANPTATLAWVGGPEAKPDTYLTLFRLTADGKEERVTEAEIKLMKNGEKEHTWNNMPLTDRKGRSYTYITRQTNAGGVPIEVPHYSKTENAMNVTNYFVPEESASAKLRKIWDDNKTEHPTVHFALYRKIEGGTVEAVPLDKAPIISLTAPNSYEGMWTGLEKTDKDGNPYIFSVVEMIQQADKSFIPGAPEGYDVHVDGMVVTNILKVQPPTPTPIPTPTPTGGKQDTTKPVPRSGEATAKPLYWLMFLGLAGALYLLKRRKTTKE